MYESKQPTIFLNNFTLFVGANRRWIEVQAIQKDGKGPWPQWPQMSGEFVIYSNDMRNAIGELLPENNQANSILGSCFSDFEAGIIEFKGCETFTKSEIKDVIDGIHANVFAYYVNLFGHTVVVQPK